MNVPKQSMSSNVRNFPAFIHSGEVSYTELQNYTHMITSLGGKLIECKNDQFISSCTHILCFSFFGSVKIMGGLASGKWLLEKEYVLESYKAGKWLSEEGFEVTNCFQVAKYHRLKKRKLYEGSIFYVEGVSPIHTKSLTRVLLAGGAQMVNKRDIVEKHMNVEFAITSLNNLANVQSLVRPSTPILKLEYIKETVFFKVDPKLKGKFLLNPDSLRLTQLGSSFGKDGESESLIRKFCQPPPTPTQTTPSKQRIRHRTRVAEVLPRRQTSIASYFLKNADAAALFKRQKLDYAYSSSEVEIIKEVKTVESDPDCILLDGPPPDPKEGKEVGGSGEGVDAPPAEDTQRPSREATSIPSLPPEQSSHSESKMGVAKKILQEVQDNALGNTPKKEGEAKPPQTDSAGNENMRKALTYRQNIHRVRESKSATIVIDLPTISTIITSYIIQLNTSHHYLTSQHIPNYSYKSKELTKASELRPEDSLCISTMEEDELSIVSKKVGCYKVSVAERRKKKKKEEGLQSSSDDRIIAFESLEWLMLRIQSDVYPSHASLGLMLKNNVLKCPFRDVSDRALGVFLGVVQLHPPHNKRMRDYYLNVFQKASSEAESPPPSPYKGWSFVSLLVRDLLSNDTEYDVHAALDYVTQVLELDLIHYNESPISSSSLLSHRVFWVGVHQKPSVMNAAVKELIQFWMRSAEGSHCARRKVTKLVCLLLEMVWKWCDLGNPFLLAEWPLPGSWMPLADEFMAQFKEVRIARHALLLVEGVTVPWQQMLLASLALRALSPPGQGNLQLSVSSLKSKLGEEVKQCRQEEENEEILPHPVHARFLVLLIMSYVQTMGVKYCKSALIRRFHQTLKKSDVLHSHSSPENSSYHSDQPSTPCKTNSSDNSNSSSSNNNSCGSGSPSTEASSERKRKFEDDSGEGCSARPPCEEDVGSPVLKDMVRRSMSLFRQMQPYIKDLNGLKGKCSHVCDSYFTQAL